MSTRKAIKSIKTHLEERNHESALYESTQLLKSLAKDSPEAVQVLVFRGLALTQAERYDEAEKSYLQANRLDQANPLAIVGLRKLYEKQQSWDKLGAFLELQVQQAFDQQDADKCAALLQELVEHRRSHGTEERLYGILQSLVTSSSLISLLQSATPPTGSYTPFPSPSYPPASFAVLPQLPKTLPHVYHLVASLPLLLNLLIRAQSLVHTTTEQKVRVGRQRLNAGPEKEVKKNVEHEVLSGSLGMEMISLLEEVARHPQVDDEVRRNVEVQQFGFWRKLLGGPKSPQSSTKTASSLKIGKGANLPPKPITAGSDDSSLPEAPLFRRAQISLPPQNDILAKVDALADGFVLLEVADSGAEEAWTWVIEGKDQPDLLYDLDLLHKFAKTFPESSMSDFIDDYCRWFHLPLPEPEEEDDPSPPAALKDEPKVVKAKKSRWQRKKGLNARERRKARRLAGKEGTLAEDLDQEEKEELVSSMTKLLDKLPKSIFVHRVMARVSIQEEDWQNAIAYAEKAKSLLKELVTERGTQMPNALLSVDTALAVALVPYYPPKHHARAAKLLQSVLNDQPDNTEARFARAQIMQTALQWAQARLEFQTILDQAGSPKDQVAAREELGWCLVNEQKLVEGRDVLEEVVQVRETRAEQENKEDEAYPRARAWWRLGRCEWLIGDARSRAHAEEWFMASCRALPSFAPAYTSLGMCYETANPPDEDRALKCYQKAFELDATQAEAARRLAIGYANDDEWALVRTIAVRVMEGEGGVEGVAGGDVMNPTGRFAPKNGWAWKALGSTEMHYRNYTKASQAYQIALRADQNDVSTWVLLGEAYLKLGRHMAALKTLDHALELDPRSWMARYHIGQTYFELGAFEKAIEAYEAASSLAGGSTFGIIAALSQAHLAQGRHSLAGGFRERAKSAFEAALGLAHDLLASRSGHRAWAWKTVGDATFDLSKLETTDLDAEKNATTLKPVLRHLVADDTDHKSDIEGLGRPSVLLDQPVSLGHALKASAFAYAYRAWLLNLEPRVSMYATYDLASALHTLAVAPNTPMEMKDGCLKSAISAIRSALEKDASDERLWNAMGVICASAGPALAQHAFVVSLELYSKDPISWTNLGYLYLKLGDLDLANECFLKAQVLDPDYAKAWLGQGLIAQQRGELAQAGALFAHSVTLSAGALIEADLAHAASLFAPFLQPFSAKINTSVLHGTAFALKKYIHRRPSDSAASQLYALICERLKLKSEAMAALETAAHLLEAEFEATESEKTERQYVLSLCNLGRLRLSAAAYDTATEAYENCLELISERMDDQARRLRVQCLLGKAISSFWLNDIEDSLAHFEQCLEVCDVKETEEVTVLLARTLWGLGGEDARETAKSHLMECLSADNPSIKVIATLGAIGVTTSDPELLEASVSELLALAPEQRAADPARQADLVLVNHFLAEDKPDSALSVLEASLQYDPTNLTARLRLAKLLLGLGRASDVASLLAKVEGQIRGDSVLESQMEVLLSLAGSTVAQEGGTTAGAARGVMLAPWREESWQGLAYARTSQQTSS